nr:MAG TPA: hypothetical protein [Caudoviricetes sp.]
MRTYSIMKREKQRFNPLTILLRSCYIKKPSP